MGKNIKWVGVGVVAAALCVGCGASRSLCDARVGFGEARDAGAETKAPYEFYAAETYLQLAEHEFDEVDLKQTRIYAEKSQEFSRQAVEQAGGGAQ